MTRTCLAIILAAGLLLGWGPLLGSTPAAWVAPRLFPTQKADIHFEHSSDLDELARRLGAVAPDNALQADQALLAEKIDGMLAEISQILKKWPLRPVRLQIRLVRGGLQTQPPPLGLRGPRGQGGHAARPSPEAYYDPRTRTIFLSLAHARPGVLAHEMTHFILCEAYPTWPSETFQEELARYVEDRFNRAERQAASRLVQPGPPSAPGETGWQERPGGQWVAP